MLAGLVLAFLAGILSILSPCVLPILPIVLGTAASEGKYGPVSLGAGMILSFVSIGLFVAPAGFLIGLDAGFFRALAAIMLIVVGVVLTAPLLQNRLAVVAGPVSGWANSQLSVSSGSGISAQFGVGILLGAVWSPCVGPTLGAASLLAAQGNDLLQVTMTMLFFGFGATVPLLLLGLLSREILLRWKERMMNASKNFKTVLGAILVATGFLMLTGLDKTAEAALVQASPAWLISLTTRF